MNNEPVAWMQTWENQDGELKQTVNIEQIGKQDIPLYTNPVKEDEGKVCAMCGAIAYDPVITYPVKELNDGGEPVKNATYWKRQYNLMATQNDNLKSGLYHANEQIKYLESHPVKELTDEDLDKLIKDAEQNDYMEMYIVGLIDGFNRARAILRKTQENG